MFFSKDIHKVMTEKDIHTEYMPYRQKTVQKQLKSGLKHQNK